MVQREEGSITLEEIWQIPEMMERALKPKNNIQDLAEKIINNKIKLIHLVGDGTSYHAGIVGSYLLNQLSKFKAFAEVSPEFPYLVGSILNEEDLVIGISQSGESEMTVESLKVAKSKGTLTAAITNNKESALAGVSDNLIEMNCTKERGLLATKTYTNTLAILSKLAIQLAYLNKSINEEAYSVMMKELMGIPQVIKESMQYFQKQVRQFVPYFKFAPVCFVLGSGPDYGSALEISLKLIEGAQIFSQAYSTAEFVHGPWILADPSSWIFAIIPSEGTRRSTILKLLNKVKKRGATVTSIYTTEIMDDDVDFGIRVPQTNAMFQPLVSIVPAQMFTVEIALKKGINPDKPKWLTKVSSV